MQTRRKFIKNLSTSALVLTIPSTPGCFSIKTIEARVSLKSNTVKKALVVWYSQTGYTKINALLTAKTLEGLGIDVTTSEIKYFQPEKTNQFDLIIIGSPVFYYDTPEYVKNWIKKLPDLSGTAVASFVTFGGPEGNQHNAACSILELLAEKNGVPVGLNAFMNMGSYPLSWSDQSEEEIVKDESKWKHSHLPDQTTYGKVREYAKYIVKQVQQGKDEHFTKKMTLREFSTFFAPIWWTKLMIKDHSIKENTCIECGICVEKCPVNAIDLDKSFIDTNTCVLCFACINNCPVQAVHMGYKDKKVIGYNHFMELNNFKRKLPSELKGMNSEE